jgi:hypothetical protein
MGLVGVAGELAAAAGKPSSGIRRRRGSSPVLVPELIDFQTGRVEPVRRAVNDVYGSGIRDAPYLLARYADGDVLVAAGVEASCCQPPAERVLAPAVSLTSLTS